MTVMVPAGPAGVVSLRFRFVSFLFAAGHNGPTVPFALRPLRFS